MFADNNKITRNSNSLNRYATSICPHVVCNLFAASQNNKLKRRIAMCDYLQCLLPLKDIHLWNRFRSLFLWRPLSVHTSALLFSSQFLPGCACLSLLPIKLQGTKTHAFTPEHSAGWQHLIITHMFKHLRVSTRTRASSNYRLRF